MEKNTNTSAHLYSKKVWTLLYFGTLLMALMYSVLSNTSLPDNRDLINHLVLIFNAGQEISAGQFPLRYMESTQAFLYPIFQFYSSTTYTLSGLFGFLTQNPLLIFKIMTGLALTLSAYSMYYLLNTLFKDKLAALIGSAMYLTAPYMIILTNQFYSFNEIMALCLLPSVIYYTLQRYNHIHNKTLLLKMTLGWYLLITIHLVTFFYFFLLFAGFLIALTLSAKKQMPKLMACLSPISLALLLSAWYWVPVVMFEKYLVIHSSFQNIFDLTSGATLQQLFAFSPFQLNEQGHVSALNPALGWPLILSLGAYLVLSVKKISLGTAPGYTFLPFFLGLFIITIATIILSSAVWQLLPDAFRIVQYSWRLLSQASWAGVIVATGVISFMIQNLIHGRKIALAFLAFILIATCMSVRHTSSSVSLASVLDKPQLRYGQTNYLIDNPQFISAIDNIKLDALVENHSLQVNKTYYLTKELWLAASAPQIVMTGQLTGPKHASVNLQALVEGKKIATLKVTRGEFHWAIPLNHLHFADQKPLALQFSLKTKNSTADLRIDTLSMKGFSTDAQLLDLNSPHLACTSNKGITTCQASTTQQTQWIELPAYYYPDLYRVMLNNQPIAYHAIFKDGKAIMAIHPERAGYNQVSIHFVGITWANHISWMGMVLALFLLIPHKKKVLKTEAEAISSLKVRIRFVQK